MSIGYNTSPSPIRGLDVSLHRKLTYEEEFFEIKAKRLETENIRLMEQNMILRRRVTDVESSLLLMEENSRLSLELQTAKEQIERMARLLNQGVQDSDLQTYEHQSFKRLFQVELQGKVNEINDLKNQLLALRIEKDNEIEDLKAKRLLERSRTQVVTSTSEETSTFVDRELRKLVDQLRQKNLAIEELTKAHLKQVRRAEAKEKEVAELTQSLTQAVATAVQETETEKNRTQSQLRNQIDQLRETERRLMGEVHGLDIQLKGRDERLAETAVIIDDFKSQIEGLKLIIEKQREDHLAEVTNILSESKVRRRSSRLISSQRSFAEGTGEGGPGEKLPTVHEEEIKESRLHQESIQNKPLSEVYERRINEMKRSWELRTRKLEQEVARLERLVHDKQEEVLLILQRFAPLVNIHAEKVSLEEDRRERLEKHWKAEIGMLEALLEKYRVRSWKTERLGAEGREAAAEVKDAPAPPAAEL